MHLRQLLQKCSNQLDCVGHVVRNDLAVSLPRVTVGMLLQAEAWNMLEYAALNLRII